MENRDRDCLTETARKDSGRRTFLKIAGGAVAAATGLAGILDFGRAPAWVKAKKFPGEALAQGTTEPAVVGAWSGTVDLRPIGVRGFQRLWNINNAADPIAEDGVYGPATESRLRQSPSAGFANPAPCPTPPDAGSSPATE